jgi:hypothetical protein
MAKTKHYDKYANLRKDTHDRGHYNKDGSPKRTLTEQVAEGTAVWVLETQGDVVYPYSCDVCFGWHVGKRRNLDDQ